MSRTKLPFLLPAQFVDANPTVLPQYVSRFMDDYFLDERLNPWEQLPMGRYAQPLLPTDVLSLQIQSNAGQPAMTIIDCHQQQIQSYVFTQKQQNQYDPAFYIYEVNAAMNSLPVGDYFARLDIGDKTFISELLRLQTDQTGTLLIEASHRNFYGDIIFETGFLPSMRVYGFLKLKTVASKDTIYEDQVLDVVMVRSRPYRTFELHVIGCPDWLADKLNWMLGCSNFKVDGRYFSKNEGAKLEEKDPIGNGALKSYKIELRESIARASKLIDSNIPVNQSATIILNSTSKGFADTSTNAGSSVVQFLDVE